MADDKTDEKAPTTNMQKGLGLLAILVVAGGSIYTTITGEEVPGMECEPCPLEHVTQVNPEVPAPEASPQVNEAKSEEKHEVAP